MRSGSPGRAPSCRPTQSHVQSSDFTGIVRNQSDEVSKIAKSALQILVFVAFFPYPAITQFGSATGIQLYEILAVIIVCLTLPKLVRAKSTLAFLILMSPVLMSLGALAFLGGGGDVDLAIRVVLMLLPSLSI